MGLVVIPILKSIHDIRRDNLRQLIDARFGGSQTKFAQEVGLGQPSFVSRLLTDRAPTRKNIGHRLARRVEAALGLTLNSLDTPSREVDRPLNVVESRARFDLDLLTDADLTPAFGPDQARALLSEKEAGDRRVRLLGADDLGRFASIALVYEAATTGEMIPVRTASAPRAVALRLDDDAMGERFPAGSIVVIAGTNPPKANSFVVGVLPGAHVAIMRQWAEAADRRFLIPLNRTYQAIEVTSEFRLLGVVVEAILFF